GDLPFNPQTPDLVAARPGWNTITAVRNGAIYAVPAELYSTPGPRLVQGLEDLAKLLHPDRFTGQ
ncbi:MAG: ABC transporter substrate-binding protein, partial [Chloroflexi bacterium]|nr:ABC transporter substrate-binding protein [Chloroflexota bacterium]